MELVALGIDGAAYVGMGTLVLAAACLQGIGGVGFAMLAAPIASLAFPMMVPGPLLMLGGAVSLLSAMREFGAIDWPAAGSALVGRSVGTAIAAAAMAVISASLLSIGFALLILAAVAISAVGWRVQPSRRNACAAGIASGLMGTITSVGAPPFAIALQHMEPRRLRATVGCVLGAGAAISLTTLAGLGRLPAPQRLLGLSLLPWLLVGFALSTPLARRASAASVRRILLALAALGAIGILLKEAA